MDMEDENRRVSISDLAAEFDDGWMNDLGTRRLSEPVSPAAAQRELRDSFDIIATLSPVLTPTCAVCTAR